MVRSCFAAVAAALMLGVGALPGATAPPQPAAAVRTGAVPPAPPDSVVVQEVALDVEADPSGAFAAPAEPSPDAPSSGQPVVDPLAEPVVAQPGGASDGRVDTPPIDASQVDTLGVTWPKGTPADVLDPQIRMRADGRWSDWTPLDSDIAPDEGTADARTVRDGTDSVWVGDADAVQLSFAATPEGGPDDMQIALVRPADAVEAGGSGATVSPAAFVASRGEVRSAAATNAPAVISRGDWGARPEACTPDVAFGLVGAVVHHTAGSNSYATVAQAMAQIRGDQAYHIDGRGWCDIGYNFVVDKWGNIYEGRANSLTQPVIGVHAGGFNTGTVGVAMLGDYSTVAPSAAELDAVARVIGYLLGAYGRNPDGLVTYTTLGGENSRFTPGTTLTLPVVMGHRDVAYTACPGNLGYAALPWIRVRARQIAYSEPLVRALYADMLQRDVDPTGLSTWSAALLGGTGASFLGDQIAHSAEYVQRRVADAYAQVLGRDPDPTGMATWSAAIMSGRLRVEDLRGQLIQSDEYYARAGGADAAYVQALYRDILHRDPAPEEVAGWVAQIAPRGRGVVSNGVWRSLESAQLRVSEAFRTYLGRTADPTGLSTWAPYWQAHGEDALRAMVIGSDEYLSRASARFL